MTDKKICTADEMKAAVEEASHEEQLADGSKVKHKLMRVRSESMDKKTIERMVEVIEKLKAPKEQVTIEVKENVLPDGTVHRIKKVTTHSVAHIERQHRHEGHTEKVFDGDITIPGSQSQETLETFEKPPYPETVVEHVDEVLSTGKVQKRKVVKNRMIHNIKTRHHSIDSDQTSRNEEYEINEVIPGTESTWYADSDEGSESGSDTESKCEKVDLGRVEEIAEDGTVITKEIVQTRTTTTRTVHSRSGSLDKETTQSVLTEEFITPSPSPRSASPVDPKLK